MGTKEYAKRIRSVNSALLRGIGTFLLGAAVVAAVLFVFSPVGKWACVDCTNETHWTLFGMVGFMATIVIVVVLGVIYAIGQFTKEQAQEVVWAYHRRQYRLHKKPMPPLPGQSDDFPHST